MDDRYGRDILSQPRRAKPKAPEVAGELGMVVEDIATGYCGAIVGWEKTYAADMVRLEDRRGATRVFHAYPAAFLLEGKPVTLVRPKGRGPNTPQATVPEPGRRIQTASGSRALPKQRARTARASRIFVEGVHDATLLERVWGDDLRAEGIVVMSLDGLDNLDDALADFAPAAHRRAGVLVDHLVAGSKEAKLTAEVGPDVLVCGHPYVDVWQAVKPSAVKIDAWPVIPRGTDWKTGICDALGWGTPQDGWRRVLGAVSSFRELEVPLIRSVEELLDFVTEPPE